MTSLFGGTPRDPKRIPEILNQIETIWSKRPDLRLCQLIGNCFKGDTGVKFYYTEDDDLLRKLEIMYKDAED